MPLVPLALEQQGHDKLTIGLVSAAWGVGMLAIGTRIPRLAARFGAVPAIIGAVVAGALITVAYTLTAGPVAWVVLTFLHGVIGGVPWVVSEIWMNVVVEEKRRGRVMGIYACMVALGMALGPLVLQVVGVYGPVPFLTGAALSLLVAVPLLPYWHTAPRIRVDAASGFAAVVVLAPLAHVRRLRLRPGRAGRLQLPAGLCRRRRRVGRDRRAVAVGLRDGQRRAAMADRLAGRSCRPPRSCWPAARWPAPCWWLRCRWSRRSRPAIIAVVMLWGGMSFAIYPVGLALLGQRFRGGDIARANTAFSMIYILGGLVGRPLAGAAMDAFGDPGLGWTLAVFYAIAGARRLAGLAPAPADISAATMSDPLLEPLLAGDRRALAQAITLIESTRADHRERADALLAALLPHTGKSVRLGITGVPGVGKSTFIERFGLSLLERGRSLAVLAIDPSSKRGGGSILGDKTRMEELSRQQRGLHPALAAPARPWAAWRGARARRCCWSRRRASTR